jgi:CheY-like chemotaxis protein
MPPESTKRTARILIVDDDEVDRMLSRAVLGGAGHELLFAPDGEVALRIFQSENVDLVITDLAMPKLNGLRLIQHLIEHDPRARIIAVSGVSPEQLDMAEQFGATRVMFKPLKPEDLLRVVTETLESTYVPPPSDLWV